MLIDESSLTDLELLVYELVLLVQCSKALKSHTRVNILYLSRSCWGILLYEFIYLQKHRVKLHLQATVKLLTLPEQVMAV